MSLLHLPIGRNRNSSTRRRPKAFRPSLSPSLEGLEQRTVLSAAAAAAVVAPAIPVSPVAITGAQVTNIVVQDATHLLATLNLTGTLTNKAGVTTNFALPSVQVPIALSVPDPSTAGVPILHLSLEIPDLNLLGLHVRLDDCNGGPVTVDLTAVPGDGLLGDLLGGLLGGGGGLNLGNLTGTNLLTTLTNDVRTILNGLLTDLTTGSLIGTPGGTMTPGGTQTDTIPAGDTELVDLHIGEIHANILGLHLDTSQICLNLYADPNGGLLGSLLSSLDNLLNNNGNNTHASDVLIGNILRGLNGLRL